MGFIFGGPDYLNWRIPSEVWEVKHRLGVCGEPIEFEGLCFADYVDDYDQYIVKLDNAAVIKGVFLPAGTFVEIYDKWERFEWGFELPLGEVTEVPYTATENGTQYVEVRGGARTLYKRDGTIFAPLFHNAVIDKVPCARKDVDSYIDDHLVAKGYAVIRGGALSTCVLSEDVEFEWVTVKGGANVWLKDGQLLKAEAVTCEHPVAKFAGSEFYAVKIDKDDHLFGYTDCGLHKLKVLPVNKFIIHLKRGIEKYL